MDDIVYCQPGIVVVEKPPCVRTLIVLNDSLTEEIKEHTFLPISGDSKYYRLALPWQVYIMEDEFVYLAFRNSPLTQADQTLYYPQLWNINCSLRLCFGNARYQKGDIDSRIEAVWTSEWNIGEEQTAYSFSSDPRVATWKSWAEHTKINPDFIADVHWAKFGDLDKLLQHVNRIRQLRDEYE